MESFHDKRAKEFQDQYMGKETTLDVDEFVKWTYGVQQ